jgi:hypothetical protein
MLCSLDIGVVSSFSNSGFGRFDYYIITWFFYVERDVGLRRGGFLLYGIFCWKIVSFSTSLEINYAKHSNLSCSFW